MLRLRNIKSWSRSHQERNQLPAQLYETCEPCELAATFVDQVFYLQVSERASLATASTLRNGSRGLFRRMDFMAGTNRATGISCLVITYSALFSITNARFWTGLRTFFSLPPAKCVCPRSDPPQAASVCGSPLPKAANVSAHSPPSLRTSSSSCRKSVRLSHSLGRSRSALPLLPPALRRTLSFPGSLFSASRSFLTLPLNPAKRLKNSLSSFRGEHQGRRHRNWNGLFYGAMT
jgi:hypothetical protein